ncbi:hypothetical protein CkaCkLH20_00782 [Colletotrichum karsti]|uniref:Uncharacterized protein n=1 Tax=Colletotrichum karsti TaxID=1095194 RepID=A0A9P6IGH9_9PEZI|nr:uncharacterized protein CkaCkLH20_00782 [Colletotrichum karsti]KAF9881636.1 hypothetical protein CkaCkLH20_00782 [Colletotrichum karsti]
MLVPIALVSFLASSALGCGLNSVYQYPNAAQYTYDCRELATDGYGLAICLLQRNTLNAVMGCANVDSNEVISWQVQRGTTIDSLDLIPPDSMTADKLQIADNDADGQLRITPRGLLLVASYLPSCQKCNVEAAFAKCPYNNFQKFIACLCCELVDVKKIACLEDCIFNTNYGLYSQIAQFKRMSWTCQASCTRRTKKNGSAAQIEDSAFSSTNGTVPSCDPNLFKVRNGEMVSDCDDPESFSNTITLITETSTWSKIGQYTEPTAAVTTNTLGGQIATGTQSAGGAAETVTLEGAASTSATASASSSGSGAESSAMGVEAPILLVLVLVSASLLSV